MKNKIIFFILSASTSVFSTTKEVFASHVALFNATMDFSLTDGAQEEDDFEKVFMHLKNFFDENISNGNQKLDVAIQGLKEEELKSITYFLLKHSPIERSVSQSKPRVRLIPRDFDKFYLNMRDIIEVLKLESGPVQKNVFTAAFYWLIFLKSLNLFSQKHVAIPRDLIDFSLAAFHNFVMSLNNLLSVNTLPRRFNFSCFDQAFSCNQPAISSRIEHYLKYFDLCIDFHKFLIGPKIFLILLIQSLTESKIHPEAKLCLVELLSNVIEPKFSESDLISRSDISFITVTTEYEYPTDPFKEVGVSVESLPAAKSD